MERNRHWAKETRRSSRNTTVSFFRWAHRKGHIPADPAAGLPVVRPAAPLPGPAPDAVWRHAIQVADPWTRLMLRLAAEVGLRRAEVAQVDTRGLTIGAGGPQLAGPRQGRQVARGAAGRRPGSADRAGSPGAHLGDGGLRRRGIPIPRR